MQTFLKAVAQDLVEKNIDFATSAIIFPNKRTGLFFNRELFSILQKPFWSPNFLSINELFQKESDLQICDSFMLNYILYKIYSKHIIARNPAMDESFDQFYFWGQMLLRDFDDLDKNLVDSRQLFINLQQIKELEKPLDYLSSEQIELIQKYFNDFSTQNKSNMQKIFMDIWHILGPVYMDFKNVLQEQNLGYEGMVARSVIEKYKENGLTDTKYNQYIFVGFNMLDETERTLFTLYKNAKKALFYWDYDQAYLEIENHEAASFLKQNLQSFGNELTNSDLFDNLKNKDRPSAKKINFISAPTENAQARYADTWLKAQDEKEQQSADTAIILCNEKLLLPVLSSVENLDKANITMGFPIQNTPVASLINAWVNMQTNGYKWSNVLAVIEHPFVLPLFTPKQVSELKKQHALFLSPQSIHGEDAKLQIIFTRCTQALEMLTQLQKIILLTVQELQLKENYTQEDSNYTYNNLFIEAAYRALSNLNLIHDLAESKSVELSHLTLQRLLNSVLSALNVPFKGEPVLGTQIMGILETRNLDFKNIVMLSVNEGMLPKTGNDASFIPYSFRKAFGMTTPEHKNAVYAYCFFRLIQRAENISLVYNTATEGTNRGEMSRFMLQLLIEHDLNIHQYNLSADSVILRNKEQICIQSNDDIVNYLKNKIASFSPSALNTFLDCKLRFYLRYVAKLKDPNDTSEIIDNAAFGSLFHFAAELLYRKIGNRLDIEKSEGKASNFKPIEEEFRIQKTDLTAYANENALTAIADTAFRVSFFNEELETALKTNHAPDYNGEQLIRRRLLISYLLRLINIDMQLPSLSIIGLEKKISYNLQVGDLLVKIEGIADRIDRVDGDIRVLDYKTGGELKAVSIHSLFEENCKRETYNFQAFLYCCILGKEYYPNTAVRPAILHINKGFKADYLPYVQIAVPDTKPILIEEIKDFKDFRTEFETELQKTLTQIFDLSTNFEATTCIENCTFCDFKGICGI